MSSSAIPPAPPPQPVQSNAAVNAVLTVAAGPSADAVTKLPLGSLVSASVQTMESKTLMQVVTGSGTSLELKLPPNLLLPPDAQLTLQVVQQGGLPALKLLAINGRPFPAGAPAAGALPAGGMLAGLLAGAADPSAPGMAGAGAPPALGRGAAVTLGNPSGQPLAAGQLASGPLVGGPPGLTATVLRPATAGALMVPQGGGTDGQPLGPQAPPAGFADLPSGTQLTVRIASIAPPGGSPVPPLAVPTPAGQQPPQSPAAIPPGQTTPAQTQSSQPAATPAAAQSQSLPQTASPLQPQPAPFPPTAGLPGAPPSVALPGTVISHSPSGTSVVQTPAGLLSLPAGPPMPVGSSVLLEVVGSPVPPPPTPPPGPQEPLGLGPNGWPTLSSAADVLAQTDRQAAEQLIRMIPQANPRLAAALSAFAGAVRAGDFKQLGGDGAIRGLDKAGRRDLAERLKRDFMDLAEEAQVPRGDGDWKVITLPFAHGADIDPIALYVHRPNPDEDGEGGKGGQEQRFILDVRMSRLGRIQFDGLVSRENKRFDLIVRTAEPLSADIRRDITGIFAECGQLTGIKGSVGFQAGRSFVELPPCAVTGTEIVV